MQVISKLPQWQSADLALLWNLLMFPTNTMSWPAKTLDMLTFQNFVLSIDMKTTGFLDLSYSLSFTCISDRSRVLFLYGKQRQSKFHSNSTKRCPTYFYIYNLIYLGKKKNFTDIHWLWLSSTSHHLRRKSLRWLRLKNLSLVHPRHHL